MTRAPACSYGARPRGDETPCEPLCAFRSSSSPRSSARRKPARKRRTKAEIAAEALQLPVAQIGVAPIVASQARAQAPAPLVFAAASLKSALDEAAGAYARGPAPRLNYGGSLALVRQIAQGAPADVFCAADAETMDEAQAQGLIAPASRRDLFGNALVVVAPSNALMSELPFAAEAFAQALGEGRLAAGHVESVPAGRYAREALRALGLWEVVRPRLAMTENVRAALVFVARGEAPLGIVYATDAFAEPRVKIVARFPARAHAPIV
ncbi:MAG: molybdate ABC transporter substrate-binding protein, partial [Beijerinckiaceae bacterium]